MRNKSIEQEFAKDPDNVELLGLMNQLAGHGLNQIEVADLLGISPGQLSRVKKGERHASWKHVRTLREHLRRLALDRKDREMKSALRPPGASVFGVDAQVLSRLSATAAVEAFRDLLWARATELGVSTTSVSITSEVFTADGGVDASILDHGGRMLDDAGLLITGTRYQIKTGEFPIWQRTKVEEELFGRQKAPKFQNLGPAVQRTLRDKQRMVYVCFGVDPVDEKLRAAHENLKTAFKACGYPAAQVEVWGATQLSSLFQRYPALCLRLRGHDHQGFRSWQSWSADAEMKPAAHYGPEFRQQIEEFREELRSGHVPHLRLVGEPGVGKTRLALEVTKADNLAPVTLHVRDARSLLHGSFLNELIQPDERRFAILVVDECPPKDRAEVWNLLRERSDQVRLISIDHGPDTSADVKMRVFQVQPVGEAQISSIITEYGVGVLDAQRWARYCEGSPRVAHVIGENLRLNRPDILQTPATVEVWERFIVGTDHADSEGIHLRRVVLRHIALFERFGYETPVDAEARYIADIARACEPRLTWPQFQSVIKHLKERRILQGTKTLYITPRALHVHLNREFWENYGAWFDIAEAWKVMPQQLRNWFVEMLRYAHTSQAATKAVDRLLGPGGTNPVTGFPDSQTYGQLIMTLAETNPRQTLRCLQRIIGDATVSQLLQVREARQRLVWSLGLIAVWEDSFVGSAELLLKLAEAENATHSNNATGTFIDLFRLVPGMAATQAPAAARIDFLRDQLVSEAVTQRAIALKAAGAALSTRGGMRMVGPEHQGLRPTIEFWVPKTYGELWGAYRDVWEMLVEKLPLWEGEERKVLIRTLIEAARSLLELQPLVAAVLQTIESFEGDPHADVKSLIELIRCEIRYRNDKLQPDTRCRLLALNARLEGHDFPSRLRRYVTFVSTDDEYDADYRRTNVLEQKLDELAQEGMASQSLLLAQVPWLLSETSFAASELAYRLGKLDPTRTLLPVLIGAQQGLGEAAPTVFLSGYLAAIHQTDPDQWQAVMLSLADTSVIQKQFSDLVISSGMSGVVARRLVELCRSGVNDPARLGNFCFRQRVRQIEEPVFLQLIHVQLAEGRPELWSNAVRMFYGYYLGPEGKREVPEQEALRMLTWPALDTDSSAHSDAYFWSQIAAAFVARYPGRTWEFFGSLLRLATKHWSTLSDLDAAEEQVLTSVFRSDPDRAWACVAEAYSTTKGRSSSGIQHWLSGEGHAPPGGEAPGPIRFVSPITLFAWVNQNIEDHGYWLIGALPKTLDQSTAGRLTREFIVRYGDREQFRTSLWCRFHSRGWCGPASGHYRALRTQAQEWLVGEKNQTVVRWIERYIDQLSADIDQAELLEERGM